MSSELATVPQDGLTLSAQENNKFVTMRLDGQLFGLPIEAVRDVLRPQKITPVPLAPPEVAGLINLRGVIVTVLDMRVKMNLPALTEEDHKYMEIVVEYNEGLYSLMVDSVDEVMDLPESNFEPTPPNLNNSWKDISSGVYRLKDELMVVLDITALFQELDNIGQQDY